MIHQVEGFCSQLQRFSFLNCESSRQCRVELEKELNETAIWLRITRGSFAVDADFLTRLVAENT